jgi:hypothetical protein
MQTMKPLAYLTLGAIPFVSLVHSQDFVTVGLVPDFDGAVVQLDGLAGPSPTASQPAIDLFNANYGAIATGNTLSRAHFIQTMTAAFAGGYGGIANFDEGLLTFSDSVDRNVDEVRLGNLATISRGPNFYAENPDYRGKETALFDGTGPSPSGDDTLRQFSINANGTLGGASSHDLDFDLSDEISVIGLMYVNWNNFQSYQRGNSDYPNTHMRVTWSNGVDSITQMAAQYSQQDDVSNVYFGFQQPAPGYYLDGVISYTIGNSWRVWSALDQIGIAVGDGAAIPEPATYAALLGLLALGVAASRHRR